MDKYYTYILFSDKIKRFYIGSTQDIQARLLYHNNGRSKFTSKGTPWIIVYFTELNNRTDAVRLEIAIKKRGAARYLNDHNILCQNL